MRILLIHSYYKTRGGEDNVFEQESRLLQKSNDVEIFISQNKGAVKGLLQFFISIWNPKTIYRLRKKIQTFQPSVIHIHNWHFALGPSIVRLAKRNHIPVIVTLHNFRLICPSGILMHKGNLFTASIYQKFPWEAVKKRTYKNSYLLSFWLAFVVWFHKKIGTWQMVDRYITLTPFAKKIFLQSNLGVKSRQLFVKPNFVEMPAFQRKMRKGFLFVGRLSEEKGIRLLIQSFAKTNNRLKIAGTGPLLEEIKKATDIYPNIQYIGSLEKEALAEIMASSEALIFPSICYEGMPMVILEAFAMSTPVIASKLGAMESIIKDGYNGLHFEPGNADDLVKKIKSWQALTPEEKKQFQVNALQCYRDEYTAEKNIEYLMSVYRKVIDKNIADEKDEKRAFSVITTNTSVEIES